jgi:hypothetical protein
VILPQRLSSDGPAVTSPLLKLLVTLWVFSWQTDFALSIRKGYSRQDLLSLAILTVMD